MLKIMTVILMGLVVSLGYHTFIAKMPDYTATFSMLYWTIMTTVTFLITGIIKLEK